MNMQAIMKQAQKLQADMLKEKKEIDGTVYEVTKSFVTVKVMGTKKIDSINIDLKEVNQDDLEMIQDTIQVAINEVMDVIDKDTEKKLGKYSKGMPGLF